MEDLENGFSSAGAGAGSEAHSWRHGSCQRFPQILLRLKDISWAVKASLGIRAPIASADLFFSADKKILFARLQIELPSTVFTQASQQLPYSLFRLLDKARYIQQSYTLGLFINEINTVDNVEKSLHYYDLVMVWVSFSLLE